MSGVLPLSSFPAEHQERIAHLVAQPKPPDKWINLGGAQIVSRAWYEWHLARGRDMRIPRRSIPTRLREIVIQRDGPICGLCGGGVERDDIHIDHKIPWSRGGPTALDNLQVAHSACNIRKGARVGDR